MLSPEELFAEALSKPDGERVRFLAGNCNDAAVRAEVLRRICDEFTQTSPSEESPGKKKEAPLAPGTMLGHYKIQRLIGSGGDGACL